MAFGVDFVVVAVDALPVAALLVLAYNLVYALVTDVLMPGVYDIHWVYLRGVFDNTTGFALNICLLTALSLPLTVEERRPVWLRRVAYAVLLLAACAVFISGCRAGMLCVALSSIIIIGICFVLSIKQGSTLYLVCLSYR